MFLFCRKNPKHLDEFSHPAVDDEDEDELEEEEDEEVPAPPSGGRQKRAAALKQKGSAFKHL